MKNLFVFLFIFVVLLSSVLLIGCDQQAIDDTVNGFVDAGAEALGPFFEQIDTSASSGGLDSNPDIQE